MKENNRMLFMEDLARLKCGVVGCDHKSCNGELHLHQRCHMKAGLDLRCRDNVLTATCPKCRKVVVKIAVVRNLDFHPDVWLVHCEGKLMIRCMHTNEPIESVDVSVSVSVS